MSKGMIVSVGGTPEALIPSLKEYKPAFVCFFSSQQSIDKVPEIKRKLDFRFEDYKVVLDDVNDLLQCYEKALACCDFFERKKVPPEEIVVDYTGGTKVMSAALVLLAVSKGFSLSYVGGTERDKGGLGQVIDGGEQVFAQANPWEVMAIDEIKRLVLLFNRFQFEAAEKQLEDAINKVRKEDLKHYFESLRKLCQGYLLWDRFAHKKAMAPLREGLEELRRYAGISGDKAASSLANKVEENLQFLKDFSANSGNFSQPSRWHLLDLLANARRRSEEGKYDDAVARLYRSLEFLAQLKLRGEYGIDTGNVDLSRLQQRLKASEVGELRRNYFDHSDGKVKLGSKAAYHLLQWLGDELGEQYVRCKDIAGVLAARNASILAHGFTPVTKDTFGKLWELVLQFSGVNTAELPYFAKLPPRLGKAS